MSSSIHNAQTTARRQSQKNKKQSYRVTDEALLAETT